MYNFLKTAFRNLWQSRLYSVINIIGVATCITCTLLAVLYWKDERSFDNFHLNNPNIYRVTTSMIGTRGGSAEELGGTGQVQGPAFKEGVPQVVRYTRVLGGDIFSDVASENKSLRLQPLFVEPAFLDVFSFPLLRGNPATALNDLNSVILTESTARKFFNSIDVIGRRLRLDADPSFDKLGKPMQVTGVMADPPKNSSLTFDALFAFSFMQLSFEDNAWLNAYLGTFVQLQPGSDTKKVTAQFDKIFAAHAQEQLKENFRIYGFDPSIHYGLQPVTDIHLNPLARGNGNAEGGVINGSNPVYSYIFLGIALFILLMAAINFINISIASSFRRSKEVGIRKIAGSSRTRLVFQFISESAILCVIAFAISIILANATLPIFNSVTGKHLVLSESFDWRLLSYFLMVLVLIILLSGLYPASILSNFKPSEVLYGRQKLSGNNLFGRALVVTQFALALFLLISTIVYYQQMDFVRTSDLGYNPNQVIRTAVSGDRDYKAVTNLLKNELAKEPSIRALSFGNDGNPEDIEVGGQYTKAQYKIIDEHFLEAMEIPVKLGRNVSTFANDPNSVLVNEAFVKTLALQDPIGKKVWINRHYDSAFKVIVGVVKDFHFNSLREPIRPMVMYTREEPDGGMWVKFEKQRQAEAMAALQRIYKAAMPTAVYEYHFMDELNARQYVQEERWKQVISVATVISFIICCLGLFGLAHLSAGQRMREIGIRKVLGASVNQVIALLSVDFLKLIGIAFLIAVPAAWIMLESWLRDFAYRIHLTPFIFIAAGVLTVVVAFAATGFQAIKAAIANPVKSLRTE